MADIEAMLHQVRVPENQRSLLRFLWWEHGDPRTGVEEFEMCVHLFGGKASLNCSNYALKRTSVDFGEKAAKTLRKSFYIDDVLKSSPNVETAIDLISRVIGLCAAGGFNLTKFVSNNVELMQAIPDEHVRKNVNLKQLEKPKSQSEKAMGLVWNVDTDTFGYKISMQSKPLSKRGILSKLSSVYDPLGFLAPFLLHGRKIIQQILN